MEPTGSGARGSNLPNPQKTASTRNHTHTQSRPVDRGLETLDYLSPANPVQVFRDMAYVIVKGRAGGYEYDSMAASFVTSVVSRFLVHHRSLLQTDLTLRGALVEILDTFVVVGWDEARSLTYELESIFR